MKVSPKHLINSTKPQFDRRSTWALLSITKVHQLETTWKAKACDANSSHTIEKWIQSKSLEDVLST